MPVTAVIYILGALAGYLIGGINPSYLIARMKGFDIRKAGSGNAGASNAVITMGVKVGVFSALFDILKAFGSVKLAGAVIFPLLPDLSWLRAEWLAAVVGIGCVLGHVFPVFMKFRGGKGLACMGGIILAFDSWVFLIMLGALIVLVLITNYICAAPIAIALSFPVIYGVIRGDWIGAVIYAVVSPVLLLKHLENVKRIFRGTELKFSYLWKKQEAMDQVKEHLDRDAAGAADTASTVHSGAVGKTPDGEDRSTFPSGRE